MIALPVKLNKKRSNDDAPLPCAYRSDCIPIELRARSGQCNACAGRRVEGNLQLTLASAELARPAAGCMTAQLVSEIPLQSPGPGKKSDSTILGAAGGMFYVPVSNFVANVGLWRLAFKCMKVVVSGNQVSPCIPSFCGSLWTPCSASGPCVQMCVAGIAWFACSVPCLFPFLLRLSSLLLCCRHPSLPLL